MSAVIVPARRVWGWLGSQAAARLVAVLMVVYMLALGWLYHRQNAIVACQARYSEASALIGQARAAAADQDRQATDQMVAGLSEATSSEEAHVALHKYEVTRAQADLARERNQVVPPPACR